jgi:Ala-tRNA(Pro) deacylase
VLPFTFHPELMLIADPSITQHQELFFNAARLDRSVALRTADYLATAKPRLERIAAA